MEESRRSFTKTDLKKLLDNVIGKTLGEVDIEEVFKEVSDTPKRTGIAGDVIERSVLGYPSDNVQQPDILVDGLEVEVKTTGLKRLKKDRTFVAKEPLTITAVSPHKIVHEIFETSTFWHKLQRVLFVYYWYDSDRPVPAWGYANFRIKGYSFYTPSGNDKEKLKHDWEIVRDFIQSLHEQYLESAHIHYGRISTDLKKDLMLIDTAPKYPKPPRFRLKRATLNKIIQEALGAKFERLPEEFNTFEEFDRKLKELTKLYQGMTVTELVERFNIKASLNKNNDYTKAIAEKIILKMFNSNATSMGNVELFAETGIIGKSIALTSKGGRTEDTKFFPVDFDEIKNKDISFEESHFFDYFSQNQLLFIVFEENEKHELYKNNKFKGFKRLSFSEEFVEGNVQKTWDLVRDLVNNNKLVETKELTKDGEQIFNKNGVEKTSLNFPKSKDHHVFIRGTGADSSKKPFVLNGINMYRQSVWIKGKTLVELLKDVKYI